MAKNELDKIRPLGELLTLPETELTKYEQQVVTVYRKVLEKDRVDENNVDVEFLKLGSYATNNTAGFVLPNNDTVKSIDAIILLHKKHQVFYGPKTEEYPEGPRLCEAFGNKVGVPSEVGVKTIPFLKQPPYECDSCPANVYGSGAGNSKACKNQFRCVVLLPQFERPLRLHIPPSSRTDFNTYVNIAETNLKPLCCWHTKVAANYNKDAGTGNEWATYTFERLGEVGGEHVLAAMELHLQLDETWEREKKARETLFEGVGQKGQEPPDQENTPPPPGDEDLPF